MEMAGNRLASDGFRHSANQAADLTRIAVADRVGDNDLVGPGLGETDGDLDHPFFRDGTGNRATERCRDSSTQRNAQTGSGIARGGNSGEILQGFLSGAAHVSKIVFLARRKHVVDLWEFHRES